MIQGICGINLLATYLHCETRQGEEHQASSALLTARTIAKRIALRASEISCKRFIRDQTNASMLNP